MRSPPIASQDGLLIDVLAVALTVALAIAAVYLLVGIVLLPVWALGAVLRIGTLRRVGGGWWALPWLALEAGGGFVERLTAPRDGSRWKRTAPALTSAKDRDESADWARGLGTLVLWALAILGGLVLLIEGDDAIIQPLAGGPAGELLAIAIVLATAAVAATAWVLLRRYRYDSRPPAFRFALATAIIGGVLSFLFISELKVDHQLVEDYCAYGAMSERQLETCQSHVTANRVRSSDTPAARFALDGSSDAPCGAGSGPFCASVRSRRYLQEQEQ